MSDDHEFNKPPPQSKPAATPTNDCGQPAPTNPSPAVEARPAARLLEFLVCPATRGTLELSADHTELISRKARLAYPIRDGIPLLTADTARILSDDELRR